MAKDKEAKPEEKEAEEKPAEKEQVVMSRGDIVARRSGHQKEHVRYRG